ncbi:copper chaperone PCu(A)C [uncultured Jannaschia sp.]|uniref:copper chaperone PCu(A)C n=1 Tax=uncultured Jannaschia sp. TaxID=293347 RepID=UPI002637D34F|nr:copper chaperone PCu(A)C [uncultured Jannaschia sp.]
MKRILFLAALLGAPAYAQDDATSSVAIAHPFAIETVGNAPVGGGYMTIRNTGPRDDRLLAVIVAPDVAGDAQLHEMAMEDGVMRMGPLEGGIPIPAGETVTLAPGGMHVMFTQLEVGLRAGTEIPATLVFEGAGPVEIVFEVEPRGGAGGRSDH